MLSPLRIDSCCSHILHPSSPTSSSLPLLPRPLPHPSFPPRWNNYSPVCTPRRLRARICSPMVQGRYGMHYLTVQYAQSPRQCACCVFISANYGPCTIFSAQPWEFSRIPSACWHIAGTIGPRTATGTGARVSPAPWFPSPPNNPTPPIYLRALGEGFQDAAVVVCLYRGNT